MARIRTIKPSFWPDVAPLSRDARLLMAELISMADDDGRFISAPPAIIGYAYPHDSDITPAKIRKWLAEIVKHTPSPTSSVPRVHLYVVDGLEYGVLVNFRRHQRISHPQPSALPPPQGELFHT
jgi:hypothetical protein